MYAMKEIGFMDSNTMETAIQERELMRMVRHRHICKYVDSFVANGNKLYLIMEYCERGDLQQYLDRMRAMAKSGLMGTTIHS